MSNSSDDRSPWTSAGTVAGFAQAAPNGVLMRFAEAERAARRTPRAVDIGCGAGRNAVPLAGSGWNVVGLDLSWPMLEAAAARTHGEPAAGRLQLAQATMDRLPLADRCADLVIAHGIWNLAGSAAQFRQAVREGARIARAGAALFVFTFSRSTLDAEAEPVPGEPFVFTQFSGQPQCFLTADQLASELHDAGFVPDPALPLTEYNRPRPGALRTGGGPVIYEAAFRRSPSSRTP